MRLYRSSLCLWLLGMAERRASLCSPQSLDIAYVSSVRTEEIFWSSRLKSLWCVASSNYFFKALARLELPDLGSTPSTVNTVVACIRLICLIVECTFSRDYAPHCSLQQFSSLWRTWSSVILLKLPFYLIHFSKGIWELICFTLSTLLRLLLNGLQCF